MPYLLLITFPVAIGASCFLLRTQTRLVIVLAVATMLAQVALAVFIPVDQPVRLLGLTLNLDPLGQLFLIVVPAVTALMFVTTWRLPHGENYLPIALMIIGLASTIVLLLQEPFVAALLLVSAGLLSVLAIVDLPTGSSLLVEPAVIASALKYLVLMALAGVLMYMGFILINMYRPGVMPQQVEPPRIVLALLAVGFGLRLAVAPFHSWLPDLVEHAAPMVAALVIIVLNTTGLLFLISVFQFFPVIVAENEHGLALLAWLGALAALAGGLMALVQDRPRRVAGYLVVYNAGMVLFGLATITPAGLAGAVFETFNQILAVPLLLLSLALLEQPDGRAPNVVRRDLLWRWPVGGAGLLGGGLALLGLPPFSGYASKMLFYDVAARNDIVFLGLLVGATALGLLALARLAHQRLLGAPEDQPVEETPRLLGMTEVDLPAQRRLEREPPVVALAVVLLLAWCLAIGLYPKPLLAMITDMIRGLTFVREL